MNRDRFVIDLPALKEFILPVLIFIFGLQLIRGFVASLTWYLMFTVGIGSLDLIPYAFGTFLIGFLAPLLRRLAGARLSLLITAGSVAIMRVLEQISKDPGLDLWLTIAGIIFFLNFIPVFIDWTQESSSGSSERWTAGLILGLGVDAAIKGVFGLREIHTITGILPLLIILLMAAGTFWALWKEPKAGSGSEADSRSGFKTGLLAIGLILVLQLLYFQNSGWVGEISGINFPQGFIFSLAGYLAAAGGLSLGYTRPRLLHPVLAAGFGLALTLSTLITFQLGGFTVIALLLGQFYLGWGLAGIGLAENRKKPSSFWKTVLGVNGGMVLFLLLVFAYYLTLDFNLPFPREIVPAAAAGLLTILFTISSYLNRSKSDQTWKLNGVLASGALLLIPLICWIAWFPGPEPVQGDGFPVRVMTYNIHSGYQIDGYQDLEGIAREIELSGAEIIGLQEVSRGRLMDNAADMPTWLSRRLDLPFLFQATEESIWGNAILSRYPIIDSGQVELPRAGAPMGRGFIWAKIDVGADQPLLVIVTHLHHIEADTQIRLAQIPVILDFLDQQTQTVLMGDFNAEPDSEEISLLSESGLLDAWLEAGQGPGFTVDADDPYKRIDYLWVSSDLSVQEIDLIRSLASDHLPILALIAAGK